MKAPFPIQAQLTAVALTYRNAKLIADQALPRIAVASPSFKYSKFTKADSFTVPQTRVGRKGKVTEISWSASEESSSVLDYGLEDAIPYADIQAAAAAGTVAGVQPINPEARSVQLLTDLIALDREVRVAAEVFDPANYGTNTTDLNDTDTSQWDWFGDDTDEASDPLAAIDEARDGMVVTPNTFVLGRAVASKLRRHPRIVKSFHGNLGDSGKVPLEFLRDLFEFDTILVGEAFLNTAKPGQTPTLSRVWGKHAAMYYLDPNASQAQGSNPTFGFSAQWGGRIAGSREDADIGLRGGTRVRVGESIKELIVSTDVGYLFENAID
jgi:hypothetical protein